MTALMANCVCIERLKINIFLLVLFNAYISYRLENMVKPDKYADQNLQFS